MIQLTKLDPKVEESLPAEIRTIRSFYFGVLENEHSS